MQISMDIHSPNKYVLSASHAPGPGDRKHAGWGGSWDTENVSRVGLKDQNVSDQPGPSPWVGDMRLLLPVPSTVTSLAVQPCPAVGSGVWSLCRHHRAPRGPGACLHPPGLSVLLAIWSPASGPASPSFCFGCVPLVRIKPIPLLQLSSLLGTCPCHHSHRTLHLPSSQAGLSCLSFPRHTCCCTLVISQMLFPW